VIYSFSTQSALICIIFLAKSSSNGEDMSIPENIGEHFRIASKSGEWKRHKEKIYADLDTIPYRVGSSGYYEYWCAGHTHDVMPNFIIEVEEDYIALYDLGEENGRVWPKLKELFEKWRELYDAGLFISPVEKN
jgi:hypothetical protein